MTLPIRLNTAQKAARDAAVGDVVHRTVDVVQRAYLVLQSVGLDGPDLTINYHWKVGIPRPFFCRPHELNVPLTTCIVMSHDEYRRSVLEALAMYAAWTEYRQVDAAYGRAIDARTVRKPVKPVQNGEAYTRLLRILRSLY